MEQGKKTEKISKRHLEGVVTKARMQKTIVVEVTRIKEHPKYKKRYKSTKRYMAHTKKEYMVGDTVVIEESRPISKNKHWRVIEKEELKETSS